MPSRKVSSLHLLLRQVFYQQGRSQALVVQTMRQHWAQVVNHPQLGSCSQPLRLRKGILWVGCLNPALTYEFQFFRPHLLAAVQSLCGSNNVRDIRFKNVSQLDTPTPPPPSSHSPSDDSTRQHFHQLRQLL